MRHLPIFLDLEGQTVLVAGGGEQAAQKLRLLTRTPARLRVLSAEPCAEVLELSRAGRIELERREAEPRDVVGARLVYVALDDAAAAARLAGTARAAGIPVNAVDRPELCDFITPALVDRDPVVIAIGTEGHAPVLARQLRARLEAMLPSRLGQLVRWAGGLRERVADSLPPGPGRRRFWDGLFTGEIARRYLGGDHAGAEAAVDRELTGTAPTTGAVTLVGAGPGDPELLTLKALQALQEADVIVADRLASAGVLEKARRDARRILVGKTPGKPSPTQDEINAILVEEAQAGRRVVRLKGGDPLVFGRAVEEIEALEEAGIPVDIVPGVTAAVACAAAVRLPLTRREASRSLTLLTGHATDGPAEHDWAALARSGGTLAVYMGVGTASHLQARLLAAGLDPETPVTVVENGTLPRQKVAVGSIGGLVELIIDAAIKGPAMIFVGAAPLPSARQGQTIVPDLQHGEPAWTAA